MIDQTHFVLDLETLDNVPTAAITSIGCVCVQGGGIVGEFYTRINNPRGTISAETVRWWLKQEAQARTEIDGSQGGTSIVTAISDLRDFMNEFAIHEKRHVWGNGPSFDNVILRETLRAHACCELWPYPNDRDIRTLVALFPDAKKAVQFEGVRHHALHDARYEASILCVAFAQEKILGGAE
jgi:hypothetical protein